MGNCKGKCKQKDFGYKVAKQGYVIKSGIDIGQVARNSGVSIYQVGYGRCSECLLFVLTELVVCPCCGTRLRRSTKSANSRIKKLRVQTARRI